MAPLTCILELSSCVKLEVAILGSLSLTVLLCGRKATLNGHGQDQWHGYLLQLCSCRKGITAKHTCTSPQVTYPTDADLDFSLYTPELF